MELPILTIDPATTHTHTVLFLHGRGDTARNFGRTLHFMQDSQQRTLITTFPSFRWVFPQAETRDSVAPFGGRGPQWFDIWNVKDFSEREELQSTGLRESVISIHQLLNNEAALLQGKWDRIILAGISQGAATSVHTLLNLDIPSPKPADGQSIESGPRKLAAFMGFSCRMAFPGRSLADTKKVLSLDRESPDTEEILKNTPILLEHCVDDPLVLVANGRGLRDTLRGFGAQPTWKEYADGGHWINFPKGLDDVVNFIHERVLADNGSQETSDAMDMS